MESRKDTSVPRRRSLGSHLLWLCALGGLLLLAGVVGLAMVYLPPETQTALAPLWWMPLALWIGVAVPIGLISAVLLRRHARASDKIERYVSRVGKGDFPGSPLSLSTHDELQQVGDAISEAIGSLRQKNRAVAELSVAADIQKSMLPHTFPAFPEHTEVDVYASMETAREVGGDFYDLFLLDDTHVAVVVGDVSGRGVSAALFMVVTKTLIKNYALAGLSPAEVFTRVNDVLFDGNDSGAFVTAWLGILDTESGHLSYANAGHNPPLLTQSDGKFSYLKTKSGFVLAGMKGVVYRRQECVLEPNDRLFLYTDGVVGIAGPDAKPYGPRRLQGYLDAHGNEDPHTLLTGLQQELIAYLDKAELTDDLTMLSLHYKERVREKALNEQIFPASDEALADVSAFVESELERASLPGKTVLQISLALEEMFINIAHYAYATRRGSVTVGIAVQENQIKLRLTHAGMPFNPLEKGDPDISFSDDSRQMSKLGVFMAKKVMNLVTYRYEDGKNVLTMVKRKDSSV